MNPGRPQSRFTALAPRFPLLPFWLPNPPQLLAPRRPLAKSFPLSGPLVPTPVDPRRKLNLEPSERRAEVWALAKLAWDSCATIGVLL